jgi:hypothetical protein
MERRFVQACKRAGLPPPEVNSWLEIPPGDWIQPDFLWRSQRVIVELEHAPEEITRTVKALI